MKKEEFVLPEKWCVRDCKFVTDYYNEEFDDETETDTSLYFHTYIDTDTQEFKYHWFNQEEKDLSDFTIITLSQFKKYVLGMIPIKINNRKEDSKYLIPLIKQINENYTPRNMAYSSN
jgi:hypothetical protein